MRYANGMDKTTVETDTTEFPNLSGNWQSFYRYPSSGRGGDEFWGKHMLSATQTGNTVCLKTVPNSPSVITMDLTLAADGKTASGTWQEQTDPNGYYKGKVYSGTIMCTIDPDARTLNGVWRGEGGDGEVNSDVWQLTKNNVAQPGDASDVTARNTL